MNYYGSSFVIQEANAALRFLGMSENDILGWVIYFILLFFLITGGIALWYQLVFDSKEETGAISQTIGDGSSGNLQVAGDYSVQEAPPFHEVIKLSLLSGSSSVNIPGGNLKLVPTYFNGKTSIESLDEYISLTTAPDFILREENATSTTTEFKFNAQPNPQYPFSTGTQNSNTIKLGNHTYLVTFIGREGTGTTNPFLSLYKFDVEEQ